MPVAVSGAVGLHFSSANAGFSAHFALNVGAAKILQHHGTDEQRAHVLPKLLSGEWCGSTPPSARAVSGLLTAGRLWARCGTMCLSETHAGSSLTDIRTTAHPQPDGTYKIRGNKMWITAAENNFGGTIVHMVLAKLPGARTRERERAREERSERESEERSEERSEVWRVV